VAYVVGAGSAGGIAALARRSLRRAGLRGVMPATATTPALRGAPPAKERAC